MTSEADFGRLTLEQQVGQLLMVGIPGPAVTPECHEFFTELGFGGAIIFGRNCLDLNQLRTLTADLQSCAAASASGMPLLIATDQEGGIVSRITEAHGAVTLPGALAIAATGEPALARSAAGATARLLRSLGINMNLAPVADVNVNPDNPVIGARSFGEDPGLVARFVAAAVAGCQEAGALATVKHFPGHGDTATDSHLALPVIGQSRERLATVELVPFRAAIDAGVAAVMSAHILFPAVATDGRPATLSRAVLTDLLRGELGFGGLVVTDCMEMSAIAASYGSGEAAALAVRAGADLVLVSHTPARQRASYDAILAAVRAGEIPASQIAASVRRILAAKRRYARGQSAPLTDAEAEQQQALALTIARRAVTLIRDNGHILPLRAARPLCVAVGAGAATEAGAGPEEPTIAAPLAGFYPRLGRVTVAGNGSGSAEALAMLPQHDGLVVALAGGAAFPERYAAARQLLEVARQRQLPAIAVVCRAPYDAAALPEAETVIACYDARPAQLLAAAEVIAGRLVPVGRSPVTLPKSCGK